MAKDREFDTILGIKARLPYSSHWTDEEYEIWLKHQRAYAAYVDEKIQKMTDLGWKPRLQHWYEDGGKRKGWGGRVGWGEKHGWRCTDPETGEERVLLDEAVRRQEERTPGVLPRPPKRPEGMPTQKWPLFENKIVKLEPMRVPAGKVFAYADTLRSEDDGNDS